MTRFIEFYIGCNPPLLPTGVSFVIATAKGLLSPNHLVEILYEPEMPWFKIISDVEHQAEVTATIQKTLTEITEAETGMIDIDTQKNDSILEKEPEKDILVLSEEPRIMPWSTHDDTRILDLYKYDEFRFPGIMSGDNRDVWRGLEAYSGLTLHRMMDILYTIWPTLVDQSVEDFFEDYHGCSLATNMQGNLVYLQCDFKQHVLIDALDSLDIMLRISTSLQTPTSQMIYTTPEPFKFTFKLLTEVGLATKTYIREPSQDTNTNTRALEAMATLRTIHQNKKGGWMFDTTTYFLERKEQDTNKQFSALVDFRYPNKQPSITVRLPPASMALEDMPSLLDDLIPEDLSHKFQIPLGEKNNEKTALEVARDDLIGMTHTLNTLEENSAHSLDREEDLIFFEGTPRTAPVPPSEEQSLVDALPIEFKGDPETVPTPATKTNSFFEPYELRMMEMAQVLEITPGYPSLELKFGRCYFKDINTSVVEGQTSFQLEPLMNLLARTNTGFSPVLSTSGEDADALARMVTFGTKKWQLETIKPAFVFRCRVNMTEFILEVDTNDFNYRCRMPEQDITTLFIHAPLHAWDMKFCATQSRNLNPSQDSNNFLKGNDHERKNPYMEFAETLVGSLRVSTDESGDLMLQVTKDATLRGEMESIAVGIISVTVKQVVRYKDDSDGDSILNITRHETLSQSLTSSPHEVVFRGVASHKKVKRGSLNNPRQWFEASLSSARCEELLSKHQDLEEGICGPPDSPWDCEQLKSEGVFRAFCQSGFDMVTQMDKVGLTNDNGLGKNLVKLPSRNVVGLDNPPRKKLTQQNVKFEFW